MASPLEQVARSGAALMARWIREEHGRTVSIGASASIEEGLPIVELDVGGQSAALAVIPLYDANADPATLQYKAQWEERLAALGVEPCIVWTPPLAEVGDDAGDHWTGRIAEAVGALEPWQRGEVAFPVKLGVRRVGDEGSYLNAIGGLQPHWARFTNQVFGQYRLDAAAIHRLPDDPEATTQMIDLIVLVANGLRTVGQTAEINAEDTWVVQRVPDLPGPVILTASPQEWPSDGRAVRRLLRRGVRQVQERFPSLDVDLRLVAFVGIFSSLEEENVAIALKGLDPSVFGAFDVACELIDGRLRVLFGPARGSILA